MFKCVQSILRWRICLLSFTSFALISAAQAQPPRYQTLRKLDTKRFCPAAGGVVDQNELARAIIDAYKISQSLIDWNNSHNIGPDENKRALTEDLCLDAGTQRQIDICFRADSAHV
jgi:hypothetical protein